MLINEVDLIQTQFNEQMMAETEILNNRTNDNVSRPGMDGLEDTMTFEAMTLLPELHPTGLNDDDSIETQLELVLSPDENFMFCKSKLACPIFNNIRI